MATLTYHPTEEHASHFWETQHRRERKEKSAPRVPDGFPEQLQSSLAWTRAEIEGQRSNWTVELDEVDIEAIETALALFEGREDIQPTDSFTIANIVKLNHSIFQESRLRPLSYQRRFLGALKRSQTNAIMGLASTLFTGSIRRAIRRSKILLYMQGLPPISLLSMALWIVLFEES